MCSNEEYGSEIIDAGVNQCGHDRCLVSLRAISKVIIERELFISRIRDVLREYGISLGILFGSFVELTT